MLQFKDQFIIINNIQMNDSQLILLKNQGCKFSGICLTFSVFFFVTNNMIVFTIKLYSKLVKNDSFHFFHNFQLEPMKNN